MADLPARQHRAAAARTGFLERRTAGAPGVPDIVLASWTRSRSAGVSPDAVAATFHGDVDFDSRLVRCAEPVIDRLRGDLADVPMVIALTDDRARILRRVDGSSPVGRMLDRVAFSPGFGYAEGGVGTNGVGTAIEAGRPLSIVGTEHFAEPLHVFACTGAPVVDPFTARVSGVLDVSTLADHWSPLLQTLVRSAAAEISRNLLEDRSRAQRALFEAYLTADARWHQAVVAVGDSLEMSNARAQTMLDPDEMRQLQQHARFMMSSSADLNDVVTFAADRQVRMRGVRVMAGADTAGLVLRLDLVSDHAGRGSAGRRRSRPSTRVALPSPRAGSGADAGSAWASAAAEARAALSVGHRLIVLGEEGAGRCTLIVEAFGSIYPQARFVTVEAQRLGAADARDLAALATTPDGPSLVVLRDVDRLGEDGAQRAALLLSRADGARTILAATSHQVDADNAQLREVLQHIDVAVTVPPLRRRSEDLAAIVDRALGELAPGRRVRLDAGAMRLVRGYSWPGNLPELRGALAAALARRPLGEIRADDLPASCHAVPKRTLTRLEAQERDAILETLHECDGNRSAAAERLGIARSSLYRKLRTYSLEHE